MKKIISLTMIVIMLLGFSQVVNAETRMLNKVTKNIALSRENDFPQSISDLTLIRYPDFTPRIERINENWSYTCFHTSQFNVTMVFENKPYEIYEYYYIVGEYYYDKHQKLLVPFGENAENNAVRFGIINDQFVVYGNNIEDNYHFNDILEEAPIVMSGNPDYRTIVAQEPASGGWPGDDGETFYYSDVAIMPEANYIPDIQGDPFRVMIPPGYLPGKDGREFYADGHRYLVQYYKHNNNNKYYTNVKILDINKEFWIQNVFLYDPTYHAFYLDDGTDNSNSIKFKYIYRQGFNITCGRAILADENYMKFANNLYMLGNNLITTTQANGFQHIFLRTLDGLPLITIGG